MKRGFRQNLEAEEIVIKKDTTKYELSLINKMYPEAKLILEDGTEIKEDLNG